MKQPPFCPNPGCVLHREDLLIKSIRNRGMYREVIKPGVVRGDSVRR
jgi:hypothetical protein